MSHALCLEPEELVNQRLVIGSRASLVGLGRLDLLALRSDGREQSFCVRHDYTACDQVVCVCV